MANRLTHNDFVHRFWLRVQKTEACWLWIGPKSRGGYGHLRYFNRKTVLAHRFSVFLATGKWPTLPLDHLCHVRNCVRPDHLEEVTYSQNNRRSPPIAASSSGFTGVSFNKQRHKWIAYIYVNRRQLYLGSFETKESAVAARYEASKKVPA